MIENRLADPRGIDPALVSAYAQAFISGVQGAAQDAPDPRYMLAAATAQHAAVCVAEGGSGRCTPSALHEHTHCSYDLEGYIPRTDALPRPATVVCDTPGGCQRWNLDGSPPARDFAQYFIAPFNAGGKAPPALTAASV
jgi:hypothetical protein